MNLRQAYDSLEISVGRYLLTKLIPGTVLGVLFSIGLIIAFPSIFASFPGLFVCIFIPLFFLIFWILYPLLWVEIEASKIDQEMHLFITRMGILSLSEISGKGMFYILKEMKEYGRLAVEVNKIYNLVKGMRINLSDACRLVAKTTPSTIFRDFLSRLAHAMDAGEKSMEFFKNEQSVVMEQYAIKYEGALASVDVLKELFVATITATAFIIVLVFILPLLVGATIIVYILLSVFIFALVEGIFLYIFWAILPKERIWQSTGIRTKTETGIARAFIYGVVACCLVAVGIAVYWLVFHSISVPVAIAVIITPLLIPGYLGMVEEENIKRKEDLYPAYIRSLSTAAEAKTTVSSEALKKLRLHDFGPLTPHINNLYKRLSMNIDEVKSWKYFNAETGSDLISKFSDMYVRGTRVGGRPKDVGMIISTNFIKMQQLRKKRYQYSSMFTGLMYGVVIAISLPVFISIDIVRRMAVIFTKINLPTTGPQDLWRLPIFQGASFAPELLLLAGIILIVMNALICAFIIKVFSAGHETKALLHFVGLIWIGAIVSVIVEMMMQYLMGTAGMV